MQLILLAFIAALLCASPAAAGPLGNYTAECPDPPGNNAIAAVVVQALEAMRPLFVTGIPSLGVPPMDPFGPVPYLPFSVNTDALVLEGSINNTVVRNLAQFIICEVNIDIGVTPKLDLEFRMDNFHVDGLYDMDGLAVSLFPIFGHGNYTLDTYQAGFSGKAAISYNVFQDRIQIKNLALDVFFEDLELVLECILGCGDMADFINKHLGDIGTAIFDAVWGNLGPVLSQAVEDVLNDALYNVSVSDLLPTRSASGELGNANAYMDLVLANADKIIVESGLDPTPLQDLSLDLGNLVTETVTLVNGSLAGLSTLRRSGTCTLDTVVDWVFLYANIQLGPLQARYYGEVVADDGTTDTFQVDVSLNVVDVYMTARGDVFSFILDLDQFVISELGPTEVSLQGLGLFGWLAGPITEAVLNLFLNSVQELVSTQVKDIIQQALHENPWPNPY